MIRVHGPGSGSSTCSWAPGWSTVVESTAAGHDPGVDRRRRRLTGRRVDQLGQEGVGGVRCRDVGVQHGPAGGDVDLVVRRLAGVGPPTVPPVSVPVNVVDGAGVGTSDRRVTGTVVTAVKAGVAPASVSTREPGLVTRGARRRHGQASPAPRRRGRASATTGDSVPNGAQGAALAPNRRTEPGARRRSTPSRCRRPDRPPARSRSCRLPGAGCTRPACASGVNRLRFTAAPKS